jgi:guanosine-3',5'-bis(diphosphate) 3'-pyrophosphohydrolase
MSKLTDIQIVIKATNFAAIKHRDQRRKNDTKEPYVNHVIGTARLASHAGINDPEIIAACLLHDTVEDTKTTFEELIEHFGPVITEYVREVTDDKTLTKSERKAKQLEKSNTLSVGAKCVKLADKLYNLMDMNNSPPSNWTPEYIIGSGIWMKRIANNILDSENDPCSVLLPCLQHLHINFDTISRELFSKYGYNYDCIPNEQELLDNYINVLCTENKEENKQN